MSRRRFACLLVLLGVVATGRSWAAGYGTPVPAEAASLEGVWQIDLQASGLPGDGNSPPQLTARGEKQRQQHRRARARGDLSFDLTAHCSNPGVPRMMSLPTPIQILARADDVTILLEWNHLQRQIHVDGRSYPIPYPMAAGVSTGHWQGGTLVVTTRGRNAKTLLDDSIPNSEALTVEEVFSVSQEGKRLDYRVTSTDPEVLAQPWERHFIFRKKLEVPWREDVCLDRVERGEKAVPRGF